MGIKVPGSNQQRLRRYLWLSRTAFALGMGSLLAVMLGTLCLPNGAVNPEATGSFFVAASGSGWFLTESRNLFVIGGFLALCSIALWVAVRAFRYLSTARKRSTDHA